MSQSTATSTQTTGYDISCGYLGNRLTVWNRATLINHEFQMVAHIARDGASISWYDRKAGTSFPPLVIERVNVLARQQATRWQEQQAYEADCLLGYQHFLLSQGYPKERIERKEGVFERQSDKAMKALHARCDAYRRQYPERF